MKNIASKKDILDLVSGTKIYEEGGIIPTNDFLLSHLIPDSELPENVEDGDSYIIGGIKYTYRTSATQPNDREIGVDWTASLQLFRDDLLNAALNGNVPSIEVDITGVSKFVDLYEPYFLTMVLDNVIEGTTITIGEITYTFTETPTEEFDIDLASPQGNFASFIQNNPNEDIVGISEGFVFCKSFTTSMELYDKLYTPKGVKKIDTSKSTIILNPTEEAFFLMPSGNIHGQQVNILNISESFCTLVDMHNYDNGYELYANNSISCIYIDLEHGWKRIVADGTISDLFTSGGET